MEFNTNTPIYLQVIEDIKKRIILGDMTLGEKLPSVRDLAVDYMINVNTAVRIYKEMEQQGLCFTRRGLGTFIVEDSNVKEKLIKDMVETYTLQYFNSMMDIGFSPKEIVQLTQEYKVKKEK